MCRRRGGCHAEPVSWSARWTAQTSHSDSHRAGRCADVHAGRRGNPHRVACDAGRVAGCTAELRSVSRASAGGRTRALPAAAAEHRLHGAATAEEHAGCGAELCHRRPRPSAATASAHGRTSDLPAGGGGGRSTAASCSTVGAPRSHRAYGRPRMTARRVQKRRRTGRHRGSAPSGSRGRTLARRPQATSRWRTWGARLRRLRPVPAAGAGLSHASRAAVEVQHRHVHAGRVAAPVAGHDRAMSLIAVTARPR